MDAFVPDPRLMAAGRDERRTTLGPTDQARAEALVGRYGGVLEVSTQDAGTLVMQWTDPRGSVVLVQGPEPSALLSTISQAIEMDRAEFVH